MKVLFTVCARAGSKGVKSKNSRDFLGEPIVFYTIAAYEGFLERYKSEFEVVDFAVNTDSDTLIEQCEQSTVPYIYIKRTEELGGDHVAKADVICDTLIKVESVTNVKYDVIIDLDLTSPLRTVEDIYGCYQKLLQYPDANVSYTVTHARRQPHFNLVLENEEGYMEVAIPSHFITRQEAPKSYDMNASIYAYRREPLLNTKEVDVFDGKCVGWIMKDTAVLDIDSEEDYELMQVMAQYFFVKDEGMKEICERAKKYRE